MLSFIKTDCNPVLLIILLSVLTFNLACSDNPGNELTVFKALDESLGNSTNTIHRSSETIYASLEQKAADPITAQKAQIWLPKAMTVQKYAGDITAFLDNLKYQLKKAAGLKKENDKEKFAEDDKGIVNNFFDEKAMGDTLYQKLIVLKKNILSIDAQMDTVFRQTLLLTTRVFDQSNSDSHNFTKTFFSNTPVVAALATLSKFQNNVSIIENRMVAFCNEKMTYRSSDYYDVYSVIVGQNSTYVSAGEEMEITAGVGSFSRVAQPEIIVDGEKIDIDASGAAIYKFKAPLKSGRYTQLVNINFTDQEGKKRTVSKAVEYTVKK